MAHDEASAMDGPERTRCRDFVPVTRRGTKAMAVRDAPERAIGVGRSVGLKAGSSWQGRCLHRKKPGPGVLIRPDRLIVVDLNRVR
ncbi:MAG: hypothetical protein ACLQIB_17315 [Isosphaeraceae bacterium]